MSINKQLIVESFIGSSLAILLGISLLWANDREFEAEYAKTHSLKIENVRAVANSSECKPNEMFESNFGLCVKE